MRRVGQFGSLILAVATAGCLGGYSPSTPGSPGSPGSPGTPGDPGTPSGNGNGNGNTNPGGGGMTAAQLFAANVSPALDANCASCHAGTAATVGPNFLGAGNTAYYTKLTADARMVNSQPATSLLLTKGKHEGPAFSLTQGDSITAWL